MSLSNFTFWYGHRSPFLDGGVFCEESVAPQTVRLGGCAYPLQPSSTFWAIRNLTAGAAHQRDNISL